MQTITSAELADVTGYTQARLRQLKDDGVITQTGRAEYALIPTMSALFRHVKSQLAGNGTGKKAPNVALNDEKLRGAKLDNEAKERQALIERGEALTLEEWRYVSAEALLPLGNLLHKILLVEIPSEGSGRTEMELQELGRDKEDYIRKEMRAAEKVLRPESVIAKRKKK